MTLQEIKDELKKDIERYGRYWSVEYWKALGKLEGIEIAEKEFADWLENQYNIIGEGTENDEKYKMKLKNVWLSIHDKIKELRGNHA